MTYSAATPFPKKPFLAVIAQLLNIHPAYCIWKGDPEPKYLPPAPTYVFAHAIVDITHRVGVGWDDMRQTDNADGSFTLLQVGRRVLTISVDVYSHVSPLLASADDLVENLNSGIFDDTNRDQLNQMGLVLENTGTVTPLPVWDEGKYISASHTDLTIAMAVTRQATVPGGNVSIREVIGSGTETTQSGGSVVIPYDVVGS